MNIAFEPKIETYADGSKARIVISVSVDGIPCGGVTVCSGHQPDDVRDVFEGKIPLGELDPKKVRARHNTLQSE